MYIFAPRGILSVVAHTSKPGMLMVRAVTRHDLENFWPAGRVVETIDSDYRFRLTLPRKAVAARIAQAVEEIDYEKVKPAASADRAYTFLQVWGIMMDLQDQPTTRP